MTKREKKPFYEKPFDREDEMGSSRDIFSSKEALYEAEKESLRAQAHSRPAFRPEENGIHQVDLEQEHHQGPPYRSISSGIQREEYARDIEEGKARRLGQNKTPDLMKKSKKNPKKPPRKKAPRNKAA